MKKTLQWLCGGAMAALIALVSVAAQERTGTSQADLPSYRGAYSIENKTGVTIPYEYRWANKSEWKRMTLKSGATETHWYPMASISTMAMQQPQSYQLRCRGARTDRDMQISIEKGSIKGFNKLMVGFKFGTRPAPRGLDPGQCSWIDRAMRQGEPLRLEENIPEHSQSAGDYLRKPYNYWTFYVYNTGKGYFQVTRSHFGQPMNY